MAEASPSGVVQFWDWKTGAKPIPPIAMPSEPRGVAFSADGKRAAIHCFGGQIFLLDANTGAILQTLQQNPSRVPNSYPGVRFAEADKTLISFGTGHLVHVWNLETGAQRYPPLKHDYGITNDAVLSRDGQWLLTSCWDKTVRVWEFATGRSMTLLPHPEWVYTASFDTSGTRVVTCCRDGMARIWDWRNEKLAYPPCRHKDACYTAQFLSGENYLITSSRDGSVRLWDSRSARPITPPFVMRTGRWSWGSMALAEGKAEPWNAVVDAAEDYAAVGGTSYMLHTLHLGDLKEAGDLPLQDPILLGKLLSGYHVMNERDVEGLTSEQWLELWRSFRKENPGFGKRAR